MALETIASIIVKLVKLVSAHLPYLLSYQAFEQLGVKENDNAHIIYVVYEFLISLGIELHHPDSLPRGLCWRFLGSRRNMEFVRGEKLRRGDYRLRSFRRVFCLHCSVSHQSLLCYQRK